MSLSQAETLIQAVLDGDASAAERAELDRLLASDEALCATFESMRHACAMLEASPDVDPPPGLVESILSRATLRGSSRAATHQSLSGERVVATDASRARRTKQSWFTGLVHLLKEIGMNEQKPGFLGTTKGKFLVTAGVAAVALAGLSTVFDFPPGSSNTAGTIVPAERHRAPQNSAQDINVGSPSGAQSSNAGAINAASGAAGSTGAVIPNAVTPNVVSPSVASPDVVSPNVVSPNSVNPNSVSPNSVSPNMVSPNMVSPNMVSPNSVSPNMVSPNMVSPNMVSPNMVSPNMVSPNMVSPNMVSPNLVSPNAAAGVRSN